MQEAKKSGANVKKAHSYECRKNEFCGLFYYRSFEGVIK